MELAATAAFSEPESSGFIMHCTSFQSSSISPCVVLHDNDKREVILFPLPQSMQNIIHIHLFLVHSTFSLNLWDYSNFSEPLGRIGQSSRSWRVQMRWNVCMSVTAKTLLSKTTESENSETFIVFIY